MQIAGRGQRLSAVSLREAMAASATLHRVLLHNVHAFLMQTTQTALSNGRSKTEQRLARWLLMAHDRLDGDEVPLTLSSWPSCWASRSGAVTACRNWKGWN